MKRFHVLVVFLVTSVLGTFAWSHPDEAKPWTFWYWMYGAVSKPGIHADLVGMKQVGLGGCYLMPIRGVNEQPVYPGKAQQLSPKFWEMVDYAFQQADSLNLDMGIHICDGFALAGGPWITPQESMQKVVWTDTLVCGKNIKGLLLRRPNGYEGYYEDIACLAMKVSPNFSKDVLLPVLVSGTITKNEQGTN